MTDTRKADWLWLGPGMYMDEENCVMHFYADEVLRHLNTADTPENRAIVEETMAEVVREKYGDIPINEVE
jgi:hypothetical protein